jgi:type II secretory pathway pseudopilin PulG
MMRANRQSREVGFSLATVMVFTTILLVGLSEAVVNWQKAMQREREEELIFRGKQYIRAIGLWQRKFPGTLPTTIDALLNTNNTRFLRKRWKDPITNSEEWRLIKMNPDGTISGLTIVPSSVGTRDVNIPGAPTAGQRSSMGNPLSLSQTSGSSAGTQLGGQGLASQSNPLNMGSVQASDPRRSTLQGSGSPVLGGIVGVASKSEKESLKTYNGRSKYNEWEFYFIPRAPTQTGVPQGQGTRTTTPGSPTGPGTLQPPSHGPGLPLQ